MTKRLLLILAAILMTSFSSCTAQLRSGPTATDVANKAELASTENTVAAQTTIPVPQLTYFQERRTIAKWAQFWDKPSITTYLYIFMWGTPVGYYVLDGKPASINSFLTPEQQRVRADLGESNGDMLVEAPDIDGTFGHNNEGIRFFTASQIPVEAGGGGVTYIYSPVPLPLSVPKLEMQTQGGKK